MKVRPPTQREQLGVFLVAYALTKLVCEWMLARQARQAQPQPVPLHAVPDPQPVAGAWSRPTAEWGEGMQ